MLRALRTSFMALAFRRCIATVLALCVCMAFAEPLLADSCDDDAKSVSAQTQTVIGAAGQTTNSVPLSAPAGHAIHVCHCVHSHVAPLGFRQQLAAVTEYPVNVRVLNSDTTPPSVVQEPQLRPPRSLSVA